MITDEPGNITHITLKDIVEDKEMRIQLIENYLQIEIESSDKKERADVVLDSQETLKLIYQAFKAKKEDGEKWEGILLQELQKYGFQLKE